MNSVRATSLELQFNWGKETHRRSRGGIWVCARELLWSCCISSFFFLVGFISILSRFIEFVPVSFLSTHLFLLGFLSLVRFLTIFLSLFLFLILSRFLFFCMCSHFSLCLSSLSPDVFPPLSLSSRLSPNLPSHFFSLSLFICFSLSVYCTLYSFVYLFLLVSI